MQFVPITRDLAQRCRVDLNRPHVAWVGVELASGGDKGKRIIHLDTYSLEGVQLVGRYRILGMGGLVWREGLCWLWLDSVVLKRTSASRIVSSARAMLRRARALGEQRVIAARDEAPRSEKLLLLLGFERLPDHPAFLGKEIWAWPRSPLSQPSQPALPPS